MKLVSKLIPLSLILTPLTVHAVDSGDRTYSGVSGEVKITRTATLELGLFHPFSTSTSKVIALPKKKTKVEQQDLACVSQPSSWVEPQPIAKGTAFNTETKETYSYIHTPVSHTDGETVVNLYHPRAGYTWYCYKDEKRDYLSDNTGEITFTLSTKKEEALILTTIAVENPTAAGTPDSLRYASQLSSHQITNADTSEYLSSLFPIGQLAAPAPHESLEGSLKYVPGNDMAYFYSDNTELVKFGTSIIPSTGTIPQVDRILKLNNQYIGLQRKSENFGTAENPDYRYVTYITTSADLVTWTASQRVYLDIAELKHQGNEYIAFEPNGSDEFYTSTNLESWTIHDIDHAYSKLAFSADGNVLSKNNNSVEALTVKVKDLAWQQVEDLPTEDEAYNIVDIAERDGRFYALVYKSSDNSVNYVGYSDNLTEWQWNLVTAQVSSPAKAKLVVAGSNKIALEAGGARNSILYSQDLGATWSVSKSFAVETGVTDATDSYLAEHFLAPTYYDGKFYGEVVLAWPIIIADVYADQFTKYFYETDDFQTYKVWAASNNGQFLFLDNTVWYTDYLEGVQWNLYKKHVQTSIIDGAPTPPIGNNPEDNNDGKDKKSGGSLFYLLAAFALMIRIRRFFD